MKNDAIIRYDGANGGKPPRHVPSPRAEADKLRELLLDIVEEKLAELTVTQLDESVTDKELPSAHATWELKQDIDNQVEAAEAAATAAQSYAVGGTGSRTGEATDNAKYYSEQAEDASETAEQAKEEAVNAAGSAVLAKGDAEDAQQAAAESESNAEAWAVGQRNGEDVPSTDETYHNNSKYYAQQAAASAAEALASAIFVINVTLAEASGEWSVVDVDKTDAEILAAVEADRPIIAIAAQDPTVKVCFYGVDSFYEATEQSESCQLVLYAETTVSNGESNVQLGTRRLQYSYIQNGSEATTGTWTYTAEAVNVRQDDAVLEVTATNLGSGIYRTSRTYHDAASAISSGYQLNMTIIDGAKRYQVIGYNTQIVDGVNSLVLYAAAPASDAQLCPTGMAIRVYVWNATAFTYVGEQTIPTKELPNVSVADNGKVLAVVGGEWEKADPPSAGDSLPAVTSSDNGKVLGVVNGAWDKMDAPGGGDDFFFIHAVVDTNNNVTVTETDADVMAAVQANKTIVAILRTTTDAIHFFYRDASYYDSGNDYEECYLDLKRVPSIGSRSYNTEIAARHLEYNYYKSGSEEAEASWDFYEGTTTLRLYDTVFEVNVALDNGVYTPSRRCAEAWLAISQGNSLNLTIKEGDNSYSAIGYSTKTVNYINYIVIYAAATTAVADWSPEGLKVRAYKWEYASIGTGTFTYIGEQTIGGDSLPAVTSSDNGKVLGVVNGAWDKVTPEKELPSVTSTDNGDLLSVVNGQWSKSDPPYTKTGSVVTPSQDFIDAVLASLPIYNGTVV